MSNANVMKRMKTVDAHREQDMASNRKTDEKKKKKTDTSDREEPSDTLDDDLRKGENHSPRRTSHSPPKRYHTRRTKDHTDQDNNR